MTERVTFALVNPFNPNGYSTATVSRAAVESFLPMMLNSLIRDLDVHLGAACWRAAERLGLNRLELDQMRAAELTAYERRLAGDGRIATQTVEEIADGTRAVTPDMAVRLAREVRCWRDVERDDL